jgi:hypothetical protein
VARLRIGIVSESCDVLAFAEWFLVPLLLDERDFCQRKLALRIQRLMTDNVDPVSEINACCATG